MILAVVRGFQVASHGRCIRGVDVLRRAAVAPVPLLVLLRSVRCRVARRWRLLAVVIHIAVLLLVASHHFIVAEHLVVDGRELAWVPATVLG